MAIEPPSTALIHHLKSLKLATDAQLRACQKHLRHLVRDLPAFDSVWIDALVQEGVLTPFQGGRLMQAPETLRRGEFVLVDRLPHDGWPVRFRAQSLSGSRTVAIAELAVTEAERPAARDRLQRQLTAVQGMMHRHLCLATTVEESEGMLGMVSPLPVGEPLDELFVRRGRFPADVVEEIARQVLDGLSRLEQAGTLHGDLRLRHLLLGPGGRIQIINAGLVAAVHPQITIHGTLPIACYQGIAPELIGGRTERSPATEMYAVGCLLWHLLAGRSPYLPADRLEQLAAHQSGSIPDVRTIAPETPSPLAALIARLVARHPSERFRNLTTAAAECGGSQARGRARVGQFQATHRSLVPVRLGEAKRTRKRGSLQGMLTAAVLLGGTALFLVPEAGKSLLQSAGRMLQATQDGESTPQEMSRSTESITKAITKAITNSVPPAVDPTVSAESTPVGESPGLPLQETEKHSGQIILDAVGPYAAESFSAVGDLRLRGKAGIRPVIEITDQPLRLSGQRVFLENVTLRRGAAAIPDIALVEVDAQSVSLVNCEFFSGALATPGKGALDSNPGQVAIRWRHLDEGDIQPGMIESTGSQFMGGGAVFLCGSVPQSVRLTDALCVGTGALCEVEQVPSARTLRILIKQSTLRQTGPVLREHKLTSQRQTPVQIDLQQSVLDLRPGSAVVEGVGTISASWRPQVQIESTSAYLSHGSDYVGRRAEDDLELTPLDPTSLDIEGLMTADFEFAGELSVHRGNHLIKHYLADVQSDEIPGISPVQAATSSQLPVPVRAPHTTRRKVPTQP